ncbi:MAG TPA: hypothetical protein GX692_04855 [Acholeplasmataceae bacterium]|nr:hypothetical protein [Acholeplasmataceae bacterium]
MIVDNYFFTNNISHIYEKKVFNKNNPEENCTCDFYIPKYNAYIEIWGYEDDPKYEEQKIFKEKIYQSNNIKIINIYPKNIDSGIDDFLIKELLKYESLIKLFF